MTHRKRQQLRDELDREEQIINFTVTVIPWVYLYGMLMLSFFMEAYGKHVQDPRAIADFSYRAKRFINLVESGFLMLNIYGFLSPMVRWNRKFNEEEDWHIVEDWNFSADKIASLVGLVFVSVVYYFSAFPEFRNREIRDRYTLMYMGICLSLSVLGYFVIKALLKRKIYPEVSLTYQAQTALRVIQIGGMFLTLGAGILFHFALPS